MRCKIIVVIRAIMNHIWARETACSDEHPAILLADQDGAEEGYVLIEWVVNGEKTQVLASLTRPMLHQQRPKRQCQLHQEQDQEEQPKKKQSVDADESDEPSLFSSNSDRESSVAAEVHSNNPIFPPRECHTRKPAPGPTSLNADPAISGAKLQVIQHSDEEFFLRYKFGEDLIVTTTKLPLKDRYLPTNLEFGGENYELLVSKYEKREKSCRPGWKESTMGSKGLMKGYYIVCDPMVEPQDELNRLGDLCSLPPFKIGSRLELLVSPASRAANGSPRAWIREVQEFQIVEENNHLGCGFIPIDLLKALTGSSNVAAVQVRIIGPPGWFKGMLFGRPGIHKIMLPTSMQKVNPSLEDVSDKVYMLFNNVFPSKFNQLMDRNINPNLPNPPESSKKELQARPLSLMIQNLLEGCGIPHDKVLEYSSNSLEWSHRTWAFVVGVCDPFGQLPAGSVFLTGAGVGRTVDYNLFITRCPCTESTDGQVLTAIQSKPIGMATAAWNFFCGLHFGLVIFSRQGDALPVTIADGDLDGDHYFICWDLEILSFLPGPGQNTGFAVAGAASDATADTAEDLLLGQDVEYNFEGSPNPVRGITAEVTSLDGKAAYVCDFGSFGRKTLLRDEVIGDRDIIDEIRNHRGCGYRTEVLIAWKLSGTQSWQRVDLLRRENDLNAAELAEYARANDLLDDLGWNWANDYVRTPLISKIIKHQGLQVQVLWDDGETTWEQLASLKMQVEYQESLVDYAEKNQLLHKKGWIWAKQYLDQKESNWFKAVQQDIIANTVRQVEYLRLTELLHREYTKSCKSYGIDDPDTIALGQAFKQSLDICKHGGKVNLPNHLLMHVKERKLMKYIQFTSA